MPLITREFETMVDETLQRIVNANVGITNTMPGSVIRTIVESVLAEIDIQNYTIGQIYNAMNIDTATGENLDAIVSILGITRKQATYAEGTVIFGRSDIYNTDIAIQYAQIVSTKQNNNNGNIYEFIVVDNDAKLKAGELQTTVNVRALEPGSIFLPVNTINVMNTPIIGIEYVTNIVELNSGTNMETDDELRERAKQALAGLGKGTSTALRSALRELPYVVDAVVMDANRGIGTADIIVITSDIPPSIPSINEINRVIDITKSAGINVGVIYPTIRTQDINIVITDMTGASVSREIINKANDAVIKYCNNLSVGDILIVSQLERIIGNMIDNTDFDVVVRAPYANIIPLSTEVIRCGTVIINDIVTNKLDAMMTIVGVYNEDTIGYIDLGSIYNSNNGLTKNNLTISFAMWRGNTADKEANFIMRFRDASNKNTNNILFRIENGNISLSDGITLATFSGSETMNVILSTDFVNTYADNGTINGCEYTTTLYINGINCGSATNNVTNMTVNTGLGTDIQKIQIYYSATSAIIYYDDNGTAYTTHTKDLLCRIIDGDPITGAGTIIPITIISSKNIIIAE